MHKGQEILSMLSLLVLSACITFRNFLLSHYKGKVSRRTSTIEAIKLKAKTQNNIVMIGIFNNKRYCYFGFF